MLDQDLDQLTLRSRRREFEDGLFDFLLGLVVFISALPAALIFSKESLFELVEGLINHRSRTLMLLVLAYLFMLAAPWMLRAGMNRLRTTTLWKGEGFTKPLHRQVSWQVLLVSVALTIGIILGGVFAWTSGFLTDEMAVNLLPAAAGLSTSIILLSMGVSLDMPRYHWVAILGGIISIAIPFLRSAPGTSWLIFGGSWMILLLVSGVTALTSFLRTRKGIQDG
ncbi:MAG: hypothetical protein JXA97_00080 [Anaerolineales bacterium]|nr:hypothetical protein [Anaerolineales bacterium]